MEVSDSLAYMSVCIFIGSFLSITEHLYHNIYICRLQMLDHFAECVKQAKGVRQQAVQLNIFTAVLSALKVNLPVLQKL